jgi:hypothetical protein
MRFVGTNRCGRLCRREVPETGKEATGKEAAMKRLVIITGAIMLAALPVAAQTNNQTPASPCQAEPDRNSNSGNDADQAGEQKPPAGDLTRKLEPCDGVLKPPPTGDSGMTEPAPNEGKTPVIKPGEVPQQQPKQ